MDGSVVSDVTEMETGKPCGISLAVRILLLDLNDIPLGMPPESMGTLLN